MTHSTPRQQIVHIVDDDEAIRDSLNWLFDSRGLHSHCHASAEDFLAYRSNLKSGLFGCLILDIRMTGRSGLSLFDQLVEEGCRLPVIFLTGHGDVPMAVGAVKKGAFDFFEKPVDDAKLFERIQEALEIDERRQATTEQVSELQSRMGALSEREQQVMERVLAGKLNKIIADELNISMRTVEVHRSRVFEKFGVRSAVELAQKLKGASL